MTLIGSVEMKGKEGSQVNEKTAVLRNVVGRSLLPGKTGGVHFVIIGSQAYVNTLGCGQLSYCVTWRRISISCVDLTHSLGSFSH